VTNPVLNISHIKQVQWYQ